MTMAYAQVNLDKEMMYSVAFAPKKLDMVNHFRVIELQALLGQAGKNKSGKKSELKERALQLVRSPDCNKAIQNKIVELYCMRFPQQASVLRTKFSSLLNHHDNTNGKLPVSKKLQELRPAVKFKKLPFYESLSSILPSATLGSISSRCFSEFSFRINQYQADQINHQDSSLSDKDPIQIQLRFCVLNSSSDQEDKLPLNLDVQLNGYSVSLPPIIQPTKTGVKPKRPNRPLDVTNICNRVGLDRFFRLVVRWSSDNREEYAVCVNLVRQLSIDDLLHRLQQIGPTRPSVSRDVVIEKLAADPESDISTTSLAVSLRCPLGKMRMTIPARLLDCQHLQCFDASFFLMMNEKKPTWLCPVCDKPADFSNLRIDGLFREILRSCGDDEIEFTADGNWHSLKKSVDPVPNNAPIDLSQSSRMTIEQDSGKSKTMETIDLTIDSSDDEEQVKRTVIKSPPSRVSNDTPQSIISSPPEVAGSTSSLNGRLSSPFTSMQKSPLPPHFFPSKSPHSARESPAIRHRSSHPHSHAYNPYEPSRHTPVNQTPASVSPHRFSILPNGSYDSSATPSPYLSTVPPSTYPFLGPDPYKALFGPDSNPFIRSHFEMLSAQYLMNQSLATSSLPSIYPSLFSTFDLSSSQSPVSLADPKPLDYTVNDPTS